ncbi:hypothetical protein C8Q78DRAFT_268289 [Trametes maxima]|nr:hypothetical protein C8Q78DRAFT_268289 [Trametes maxima]
MVKRKRVKDVVPVQRPAQQSTKLRAPQSDRSSAFRPFTRDHRAELGHSLGDQSTELSLSSCLAWAHARNLDPAAITDWFLRRTGGECRREHAVAPTHTISGNEENVPISAPQDSHDGIRVKRERAASPILFEPPRKKPRVRQGRQTVALKRNTSHPEANPPAVILKPVRHTRAHDGNLHPACPTCNPSTWLSAPGNCSPLRTAFDRVPTVDVSLPSSSERPSPFRLVRRSGFKSALRSSSPRVPAIGSSRRVRFSQELHDEALIAYTQQKTSSQRKNIAYIDTNQGGTTLPPRQKRKYALLSQAENSTLVPAETPVLEDSAVLSLSSGRSALCDSSLDVLPSLGASCTFGNSTSCSEAAPLGSADTAWRRSAVLSSTKATVTTTHENRKYSDDTGQDTPSKKSKLSSTSSQGPDVTPVPPVFIPLAHHPARDSFPPPRTPSPRAGTTPHSGSFFSPSFFSPCPSSLSGEEVEALLVSSPPTSPSVIPRSSSPHEIMCPSPKHPLISSMISYPHPKTPGGDAHVVGAIASSPSSHSPPRISTSPFPLLVISPPADIPPRTRTPPDSGPEPGSKPCTPRPSKPSRPTAMGVISPELWEDREQGPARVVELPFPPRACTPPGGSGGGSKPCTPRPARPHRPNVDHYDLNTSQIELGITRTAIRQEEEEEWVDIRRMLAQEEEEDDVAALCDAGRAPLRPQFLPSSAFVPAPEGPPTGYIMGPTGRAECGTDVPTHPDNIAAVLRYTDTHRVGVSYMRVKHLIARCTKYPSYRH